jgi:hypothetical protein
MDATVTDTDQTCVATTRALFVIQSRHRIAGFSRKNLASVPSCVSELPAVATSLVCVSTYASAFRGYCILFPRFRSIISVPPFVSSVPCVLLHSFSPCFLS